MGSEPTVLTLRSLDGRKMSGVLSDISQMCLNLWIWKVPSGYDLFISVPVSTKPSYLVVALRMMAVVEETPWGEPGRSLLSPPGLLEMHTLAKSVAARARQDEMVLKRPE